MECQDREDNARGEVRRCSCSAGITQTLVLVSAFFCQMISLGFAFSLGVFYVEFVSSFPVGRGAVSWATSLCSGLLFGAGLVAGFCIQKAGPRVCTVVGGLVATAGVLSSSFVYTLPMLYITFGFINGFGLCLAQVSSAVAIGRHFKKSRAAATSISAVGAGIGSLVFPVLLRHLIDFYHWRGALMIFSGIVLNLVPCGLLFVPEKHRTLNKLVQRLHKIDVSVIELGTPQPVRINKSVKLSQKDKKMEKSGLANVSYIHDIQNETDTALQNKVQFQNEGLLQMGLATPNSQSPNHTVVNKLNTESLLRFKSPAHEGSEAESECRYEIESGHQPGIRVPKQQRRKLCDAAIWRNILYVIYLSLAAVISTGYSFPYVTLVDLGVQRGYDKSRSTWLILYISITSAVSTFLIGLALKLFHRRSIQFFDASLLLMGTVLFVFPSLGSYPALVGGAVAYGIAMGGLTGTYAVIVVDIIGLTQYATGFGFVCTGFGIGYLLGTPVAGWITDLTGSYDTSFYIAGCLCLGPAMIFIVAQLILHHRRKEKHSVTE